MLSPELQKTLLEPETLHVSSHLSIQERTQAILQQFGVKISRNVLALFYKANNVKFRATKKAFW